MWKWLIAAFLVCVLICAGGGYFLATNKDVKKQFEQWMPGNKPTEVRFGKVEKGELSRTVSAPGQIEPKTSVKISAQVQARIIALPFRENDQVRKGDVIVRLDARDLEAALLASRARLKGEQSRLEGSQAALARAESERERVKRLAASGDVAKSALEQAESEYLRAVSTLRSSESSIDEARAQIVRAEKDLENTVIVSPIDGTITSLNAEVGELVVVGTLNNAASVIMEIADLSQMVLKARVDESNIVPVKPNHIAKVFINAYGERAFKGVVERVELQRKVDRDNTGYFEVWIPIQLETGELLRSGLTANTEIQVETLTDVLVVPSQTVVDKKVEELPRAVTDASALIPKGNAFTRVIYALRKTDGALTADGRQKYKVVATPVSTGASDLTRTVIIAGAKEGDEVVVGPFKVLQNLRHDQDVVAETAGAAPTPAPASGKPAEPAQPPRP